MGEDAKWERLNECVSVSLSVAVDVTGEALHTPAKASWKPSRVKLCGGAMAGADLVFAGVVIREGGVEWGLPSRVYWTSGYLATPGI